MARLNSDEYHARLKRLGRMKPTSAYADGYRTGLQRNQFGERTRMEGVPSHGSILKGAALGFSEQWVRGYKHGFEGVEPTPTIGRPKSGNAKDCLISARCTKEQREKFDKLGGNEWLLEQLA